MTSTCYSYPAQLIFQSLLGVLAELLLSEEQRHPESGLSPSLSVCLLGFPPVPPLQQELMDRLENTHVTACTLKNEEQGDIMG